MSLNLHHLRLFAAVVERRGFTRAAAALRLSQPAISKSLGELERGVGMPLLERSGRATRLTEAGEALYAHAREIFGAERSAERHLRELRGLERGILRIAATPTIATYVLPALLGRFHSLHPRVDFDTTMTNAKTVARLLLEWRVDVALVEEPTADKRLDAHRWRDDELVVIGASDHRLTHDRGATVASLATETFVVPRRDSPTGRATALALARHGVVPRRTIRVGSTEAVKQAVAVGLGLGLVSRAAAEDQLALGRVAVVPVAGVTISLGFDELRLRGRTATASSRAFEEVLKSPTTERSDADASGHPG